MERQGGSPVRVFEAFAGYGSQSMALRRLSHDYPRFSFEAVGISEIDRYALQAYRAVHGDVTNYGDITRIDWGNVPDFDLFTYSFPCQDVSFAGKQQGFTEGSGTRSSLLWECRKAILAKRPRWLLMENVKALVSEKFLPLFREWEQWLASIGYRNYTQVLNAKDYGVPQNRERVFKGLQNIKVDCSPALRATDYKCPLCKWDGLRIRKLTERECFRLMDVSESDIDRIQAAGISRTQQYKMAGNSIVVAVLYHIFRKMFVETQCETRQLKLF